MNWVGLIEALNTTYMQQRDLLNALDSALGDGDHGTSLSAAFAEASAQAAALPQPAPSTVLRVTADSLMNRMGGSSGALYGTLFLRASLSMTGKADASAADWAALMTAGLEGVRQRGKADAGDKTMIDALTPAVAALRAHAQADIAVALSQAAAAAHAGAQATAQMVARHGRAKFSGERSLGHIDAGAMSVALMFETIAAYAKGQHNDEA